MMTWCDCVKEDFKTLSMSQEDVLYSSGLNGEEKSREEKENANTKSQTAPRPFKVTQGHRRLHG